MESLQTIRDSALIFLSIREHARTELRQKLLNKQFSRDAIEQVLTQLQAENLQSDARFTESWIRSRANKGYGPLRIRYELQQHEIADHLLQEFLDTNDAQWNDAARQVRHKKFGDGLPRDLKQKAKQIRFLQYRGFSTSQIKYALMALSAEDENLE